jgi:periplasmic protein TonB
MQPQAIPTASYLDIVFDNRNKAYGSYQLRKDYNKRTITAFCIVMSSIFALSLYSTLRPHTQVQPQQQLDGIVELADIHPRQ